MSPTVSILIFLIITGLIISFLLWLLRSKISVTLWVRLFIMVVLSVLTAWLGLFAIVVPTIAGPIGLVGSNMWDVASGIFLFAVLFEWVWYRTDLLRQIADNGMPVAKKKAQPKKAGAASEGG